MKGRTPTRGPRRVAQPPRRADGAWITLCSGSLQILQAAALSRLAWLVHGFSTRPAGASTLDGRRVLNLGFTAWDTRENVLANRAKLLAALGGEAMIVSTLRQIHSDVIWMFDAVPEFDANHTPRGDASVTRVPGILLAVQTADCVQILLADTKRRAVAAVHAG